MTVETDPALMSAQALLQAYARKTLSPVEATEAALARLAALDDTLNAFCLIDAEGALAAARASEARWHAGQPEGRLDGVPATVKDVVLAAGWPTRRGSRILADVAPDEADAPTTANLRRHNAVLLGKTTTPEFGWKGVTDSALHGITRNPWNPERTPGGSSGGAVAAAATGMGALHIGTDGGGSIRIPCGFTGLPGFKQSFGRVPAWPPSPFGTVAHVGPIARTVGDLALMLTAMAEPDVRDPYLMPYDPTDFTQVLEGGVAGLRIAYSPTFGGHAVHPEIAAGLDAAAGVFADLGAIVEQPDLEPADTRETFKPFWFGGAAYLFRSFSDAEVAMVDPGLQEVVAEGAGFALHQLHDAVKAREAFSIWMARLHQDYDLLLLPNMPLPAFAAGHEVPPGSGMARWTDWTPYSIPFNLTGQPAGCMPSGLTSDGLPMSIQLVGARYDDATVLRAMAAYERAKPMPLPPMAREGVPA